MEKEVDIKSLLPKADSLQQILLQLRVLKIKPKRLHLGHIMTFVFLILLHGFLIDCFYQPKQDVLIETEEDVPKQMTIKENMIKVIKAPWKIIKVWGNLDDNDEDGIKEKEKNSDIIVEICISLLDYKLELLAAFRDLRFQVRETTKGGKKPFLSIEITYFNLFSTILIAIEISIFVSNILNNVK